VNLLSTSGAACESSHLGEWREGQEPVEVAELDELVLDCTLVELEVSVELLELESLLLLEVVAPVTITVPSAPALTMPRPARTAVSRRAPWRPASRVFMECPFVVSPQRAQRHLADPMSRP
jgi:hypothetical protein